ncbi:amidophosphoribosyltransferase [Opitutales bacterium ASA1]|uniref:amidophosphoribosyltransferase n=1 Tax=Congregicoccus parvus TaxID=3081749 RepID=UPI002B2EEE38|nr:amidophosphoribosyltransferase [Opitutales bacterium ASA1]
MSDDIRHECGIALVRLKKPLEHYFLQHGTPLYGLFKLFLLMEKQHNRGQDGAGIGAVKFDMPPGEPYMFREREIKANPIDRIFRDLLKTYNGLVRDGSVHPEFPATVKKHFEFGAELYLGHLRYGTSGGYHMSVCHPFFRRSSWPTRNLMLAGNFNMTNTAELNDSLIAMGQHPIFATDTQALLEKMGYHLDVLHEELYRELRCRGLDGPDLTKVMHEEFDVAEMVRRAAKKWDGGYSLVGAIGTGDAFIVRDPNGIRPAYYYENDDVFAVASERPPLLTVFDADVENIKEVPAGHVMVIKRDGRIVCEPFTETRPRSSCSFERIYFSRGNDPDIYRERRALGAGLATQVLDAVEHDLERTVFSFIPNTAETAYEGLLEELRRRRRAEVKQSILDASRDGTLDEALLDRIVLHNWPRSAKIAHKDVKLRTFISQEKWRGEMSSHVYDITYGVAGSGDSLVCVDDSIVRGTTLRRSVLKILSRLDPKRIVVASTAPQIRYPDCYGIDMSELGKFIAFEATVELLREHGREDMLREIYERCLADLKLPVHEQHNQVKRLYDQFTADEISAKIGKLVRPRDVPWQGEVIVIYQTIENLHAALPHHGGDWYFTGRYPTPGGVRVVNQAFVNYYEKNQGRSY